MASLALLLLWAMVGALLGIIWVILVPWTAAKIAGHSWIERVSSRYVWLAQTCVRRSAILLRDGDVQLIAKRYDADHKADRDTAGGDPRHHRDSFNVLGRLQGKILGIAPSDRDTYISPLVAELGERVRKAKEEQDIGDAGEQWIDGVPVPKRSELVDLTEARFLTSGSAEPENGHEAFKKTKISQEKFHQRVSFGQGMLLILAFGGAFGIAWLGASQAPGDAPALNETTVSVLGLLAVPALADRDWSTAAAIAWIGGWTLGIPVLAALAYGAGIGLVVFGVAMLVAVVTVGGLVMFGPALPVAVGLPLARGWWILAQLTVGRGVLVERPAHGLEHHQLRDGDEIDADAEYWCRLNDGTQLPVDDEKGRLFKFAWAPLGATVQKTDQNMDKLSTDPPEEAATDGGFVRAQTRRAGKQPVVRIGDTDSWTVVLPKLWQLARRTSESEAVRQGREKALAEHGGEQQLSMLVFLGMLMTVLVLGAGFGLVAGGAIP